MSAVSPYRSAAQRGGRIALILYCAIVFAFLVLPILIVIPLSFNPTAFLVLPTDGLSLRWYEALIDSPAWMRALRNSLAVAIATTAVATPLGTLAAIGLARMESRAKPLVVAILTAPLVVPVVVVAIAFYFLFAPLGLVNGFAGLVIAHTVLATPFVVIVVHASLQDFDFEVLRAASSLGASPTTVLYRVLVPLIAPGIAAGAVFAFMTSFDETVVALFIAGPDQRTLPLQMWEGVREQISPAITAAATLLVIASAALLGAAELLRRRSERINQSRPE
ncbi:ABC transporter permease [Sphingosinicella rhizophila]|uniref:ABC transporter permease n=1 Tax=Sphingosinicella rhizophila TaxID=3050082 RepID=A0ABU3QAB0_9SPHN|nr:ABC transporter permease [Sphingosinicella sp. GR2756]MDT9600323.1 ABC transporter permease [Sphingosinicella sp. GR2756]